MADDSPTPPVEAPVLTPEEQAAADKAARIAKGRANLLPPCKPGQRLNPTGKNGRTQHAALVRWLEEKSNDDKLSRIERIWQATYLAALKGSAPDRKTLIEQHGGKPKQQLDVTSDNRPIAAVMTTDELKRMLESQMLGLDEPAEDPTAEDSATREPSN